jgi:hypothetical protein
MFRKQPIAPVTEQDVAETHDRLLNKLGTAIVPPLESGEQVVGIVQAHFEMDLPKPPDKLVPKIGPEETPHPLLGKAFAGALMVGTVLNLPGAIASAVLDAPFAIADKFQGKLMAGDWRSSAGQFIIMMTAADRMKGYTDSDFPLVFTDRRVLVYVEPLNAASRPYFLVASFPRGQIAVRAAESRKPDRTRVDLAFPDGSWVAVTTWKPAEAELLRRLLAPV